MLQAEAQEMPLPLFEQWRTIEGEYGLKARITRRMRSDRGSYEYSFKVFYGARDGREMAWVRGRFLDAYEHLLGQVRQAIEEA